MRHLGKIDLAAAVSAAAAAPQGAELTLSELVRACCIQRCDGSDLRLKKWLDAFGSRSAWSLLSEDIEAAAQAMSAHGYAPATVNRDISALGSVYRWAKINRLSPRGFKSPTLGVGRMKEPIRRLHVADADIERLRARALAYSDRRFGVFVSLLIDTGARKSELLERVWGDIDLENREILLLETKTDVPRTMFFTEQTAELIRRVIPMRPSHGLVFPGNVPGRPISYRHAWSVLVKAVGLPHLHMHDMRHVVTARLLSTGSTLAVTAQVMGHSTEVCEKRYGYLENAALRRAQEASWSKIQA